MSIFKAQSARLALWARLQWLTFRTRVNSIHVSLLRLDVKDVLIVRYKRGASGHDDLETIMNMFESIINPNGKLFETPFVLMPEGMECETLEKGALLDLLETNTDLKLQLLIDALDKSPAFTVEEKMHIKIKLVTTYE